MVRELLDIINERDQIIGQKYRSEIYEQKLTNFRVINAFLLNDKKEVWIPRRSPTKKLFPLCLDASVGGHVLAGENYDEAFVRELREELNLEAAQAPHQFLAKLTPQQHNVSAYMHVYIISTDEDPHYNSNDFMSAMWYKIPELQEKIRDGEKTKGDLPLLINLLRDTIS